MRICFPISDELIKSILTAVSFKYNGLVDERDGMWMYGEKLFDA
jgi:hypothetical protein